METEKQQTHELPKNFIVKKTKGHVHAKIKVLSHHPVIGHISFNR
jgi:hypothetical protein